MRKHFDKALYDRYDAAAKTAARTLLQHTNFVLKDSEKKTDVDFEIYKDDKLIGFLEVEVKRNWAVGPFIYNDVQWPERKWKYCNLTKPTVFLMFNADLSQYLTATGEDLLSSKIEMIRNKYVAYGESFFKVPVSKVIFNNILQSVDFL